MNFSSDKLSLIYLSIAPALPNVSEEKTRRGGEKTRRGGKKKRVNISTTKDMTHLFYSICSITPNSVFNKGKKKIIVLCESNKFSCIQHNLANNYQIYPNELQESY